MNTNEITITVDDATRRAFIARASNQPLTPDGVARALFHSYVAFAPTEVTTWLAGQRGGHGDLWRELNLPCRGRLRAELAAELQLAEAVRRVVEKRT